MNSGTLRALANATSGQRESLGPTILTRLDETNTDTYAMSLSHSDQKL